MLQIVKQKRRINILVCVSKIKWPQTKLAFTIPKNEITGPPIIFSRRSISKICELKIIQIQSILIRVASFFLFAACWL